MEPALPPPRMESSRGSLIASLVLNVRDLGIGNPEPYVDRVIRAFLARGEAVAPRRIKMPKAVLLLQMVPGDHASGALYFYDRQRQDFYMLSFTGQQVRDDDLTVDDFARILTEYNLLRYAERPFLLEALCHAAATA